MDKLINIPPPKITLSVIPTQKIYSYGEAISETLFSLRAWDKGDLVTAGINFVRVCRDFPDFIPSLLSLRYLWFQQPHLFDPYELMPQTTPDSPYLCYHVMQPPSSPLDLLEKFGKNFSSDLKQATFLSKAKKLALNKNTTSYGAAETLFADNCHPEADFSDPSICLHLHHIYAHWCDVVLNDKAKSTEIWLKLAEHGCISSMRTVANCFSTGFGFEKDSEKSLQWLCLASEKGHAVAQYELGNYYYKPGPHHSFELSFQNYVKSANNGYSYALGDLLDEEFSQYCSLFEKEIHETSARMGRPYSQSYLGSNLHRKGETVLAFPLLVAAARGGRPVAMFNLSHYFLHSHSLDHPDSLITGIRLLMNYFEMEDTKDERKEVLDYILNSAIKMWTEKKFNDAKYVFEWRLQRKDTNSQVAIKSNEISRNTWIQQSEAFLLLQNPRCNQHSIMNSVPKHLFQPIIELFKPPPFYKRLSQIAESIYPGITLSNYITDYRDTEAGLEDEFILLFLHPQSQEMPISMRYRNSSTCWIFIHCFGVI
eukprot:TRINITY_DN4997_c0_g1_i5.p1 TRINITY_DN4997_c0_g1~~TRINITY_DN4997_c0_g1_i5.p1  ORF type:complete len:539 (+),score=91.77 TRINITY_DN4997_c0_g1_i5:28-1644(+)